MTISEGLDFVIGTLLPAFFRVFDSWMLTEGVSVLGFSVAVVILTIVIGAILLRA